MVQKRVEASKLDIELQRAARNGNAKLVSQLLTKGARVNAQDVDGWTCLHAAAAEGSCATIQLLAGRDDADVNMETNDGRTALYFAALDGKVDCVRALLTSGGDAHVKNQDGKSALDVAKLFERTEVVGLLEEALKLPPPPRKILAGNDEAQTKDVDPKVKAKAEAYIAPDLNQWKKTDFGKWNKMKDEDWEALEAHQTMEDLKVDSEKKSQKPAPKSAASSEVEYKGGGKRRLLPYGKGRIGPPKELTPDHPYYAEYKEWMDMTKELEQGTGDARSSAKKKNERLYSLKPTPEGGADPDARNGSHGVGYTWGQGPPDVTIYVRLPPGVGKEDIEVQVRPTSLSLSYWTPPPPGGASKRRKHVIFNEDPLWRVLEDNNSLLTLTLQKSEGEWWRCVTDGDGHTKIDSTKCKGPDMISEYDENQQREFKAMFEKTLRK